MASYHCKARTGTRQGGQSARAKIDYLSRGGKYERGGDEVLHVESINMPIWAAEGRSERVRAASTAYWVAADEHERANGRLYKHLELALPVELTVEQNLALLRRMAHHVSTNGIPGGTLPCTFTYHRGRKENGRPSDNPHCDILISERVNDGIERSPGTWFSRVAASTKGRKVDPAAGGARKTDALKSEEWLLAVRATWAQFQNEALAAAGHAVRVDHRTLEEQGIARAAGKHFGPKAIAFEERTGEKSRRRIYQEALAEIESSIASQKSEIRDAEIDYRNWKEQSEREAKITIERARQAAIASTLESAAGRMYGILQQKQRPSAPSPRRKRRAARATASCPDQPSWMMYRKQIQSREYGHSSDWIARFFRVDRAPSGDLVFHNSRARVVDKGPLLKTSAGTDDEIDVMLELAMIKKWPTIHFHGSADFRVRAMTAALRDGGIAITTKTAEDERLLARAKAIVAGAGPPRRSKSTP